MRSILLVDDDDDVREAMTEVLMDLSFSVVGARNGMEALSLLRGGCCPDGILLDLSMPGMNGLAFLAEQVKDPSIAQIPVVLMTGASDAIEEEDVASVAAILPKPFEPPALLAALDEVLSSAA